MRRTPHDQLPWRTYRRDTSMIFGQQEMSQIPKPSRANASQVKDFGIAEDRSEEIGGYSEAIRSASCPSSPATTSAPCSPGYLGAAVPARTGAMCYSAS